jgi:hypothetical protein
MTSLVAWLDVLASTVHLARFIPAGTFQSQGGPWKS